VKKNITLLYGFSFFDQFMIVIALWIPYLTTQGITMRQFMELQAVFAIVILSGEVPSGCSRTCGDGRRPCCWARRSKPSAFPSCRSGAATRASSSITSRWGSR